MPDPETIELLIAVFVVIWISIIYFVFICFPIVGLSLMVGAVVATMILPMDLVIASSAKDNGAFHLGEKHPHDAPEVWYGVDLMDNEGPQCPYDRRQ